MRMEEERFGKKYVGADLTWNPVVVKSGIIDSNKAIVLEQELFVSNPLVPLPGGVRYASEFVSAEEEEELLKEINERDYSREGFEQRRKVQMYDMAPDKDSSTSQTGLPPRSLMALRDRLYTLMGLHADQVTVQELTADKWQKSGEFSSHWRATTFASRRLCPHCCSAQNDDKEDNTQELLKEDGCKCFVAQMALGRAALQHWNRPVSRQANCWNLKSEQHWTDVQLKRRALLVRTDECLWEWRSRTSAMPDTDMECATDQISGANGVVVVVKFYKLPQPIINNAVETEKDGFGFIPHPDDGVRKLQPRPSLEQLLTIIVTTSPIQSHPSTELLEKAMQTFLHCGPSFAYNCRKVIVCDGYRAKDDDTSVSRKHSNAKQAMRNGIVTNIQADNYQQFKQALRKLCEEAPENSVFSNTLVEELPERHGYGFALRHAVTNCVSTPFVCVVQHDRTFMRPTPMEETLTTMWNHPNVKYVGMSMRSNLMYRDIFLGKYGKVHLSQFNQATLRPKELWLDTTAYGPNSSSDVAIEAVTSKVLESIRSNADTYKTSHQNLEYLQWREEHKDTIPAGRHPLSLTPTLFWYDNVHVCETAHYREFCFNPDFKMVARGGFVEDKLSPVLVRTVERLGLLRGHARYGCFLLDDHSGLYFTGHLDGGSYQTKAGRQALLDKNRPK